MERFVTDIFLSLCMDEKDYPDEVLRNGYEALILNLAERSENDLNLIDFYTRINYLKIEFSMRKKHLIHSNEVGDKLKCEYMERAIYFIDSQIRIINWKAYGGVRNLKSGQKNHTLKSGKITWTASVSDLVEIGYSLVDGRAINNGDIDLKEFLSFLADIFNIEVKNCYSTFRDMKKRIGKSRAHFLDKLSELLNMRMDEQDMDNFPA